MIYSLAIAVPRNTAKAAPVDTELEVHPGVVTKVDVLIPARCAGLLHVQVIRNLVHVWPQYEDQSFSGDNTHWSFPEEYPVADLPYSFTVRCWNLDDTFQHTAYIALSVLPRDSAAGGGMLGGFVEMFGKLARGEL